MGNHIIWELCCISRRNCYFHSYKVVLNQRYTLIVLCIAIIIACTGQLYGQKLPFTNYNAANGLSHNRTHVVRQDGSHSIQYGGSSHSRFLQ